MTTDIIDRLKNAEAKSDGEVREVLHEAWREIAWLREGVALSKRAVEIAEEAEKELAQLRIDAARYRWLRADTPKPDLGEMLVEIRKKYIANGGKLFTADEINDEVHKNRDG